MYLSNILTDHFCDVELCHILGQPVLELGEKGEEVAPAVVVHHQVLSREQGQT